MLRALVSFTYSWHSELTSVPSSFPASITWDWFRNRKFLNEILGRHERISSLWRFSPQTRVKAQMWGLCRKLKLNWLHLIKVLSYLLFLKKGIFFFFLSFFFFAVSWAAPAAYGDSQFRSLTGAVAASLRQSHSNVGSKRRLKPTPQLMATPDHQPSKQGPGSNPQSHGS